MGLSDAQKTWMDQNWALFCVDEPWRKVDTKGPHADALARAKEQARTACPRVDAKPPGPAKTIGKKSKQANTLTAHPALAAGPEETCVTCGVYSRPHFRVARARRVPQPSRATWLVVRQDRRAPPTRDIRAVRKKAR